MLCGYTADELARAINHCGYSFTAEQIERELGAKFRSLNAIVEFTA